MFGKRFTLFRLLGFEVGADPSWLMLALLVTWSLAVGWFPNDAPGLSAATYWWMGVVGALGLFFSIIIHEFSHALVARHYGLPISGITLFLFGGVAQMAEEPTAPRTEFRMAAVGPIASLVLGGAFSLLSLGAGAAGQIAVAAVLSYLTWINLALALFNLIPAFPLDGGRMLRAVLWGRRGDLRQATRIASDIGSGFGVVLIVLGIFSVVSGDFIGGMWWFLIGLFLRGAAGASYQQTVLRQSLRGVTVGRIMNNRPVAVSPSLTIAELVEDYFYHHYYKMFPVVADDGTVVGSVTLGQIRELPRDYWADTAVAAVMGPCGSDNTVAPETDALDALAQMQRTGNGRLIVAEHGRLVGVVTLKDMLRFLNLKLELEGGEPIGLSGLALGARSDGARPDERGRRGRPHTPLHTDGSDT